MCKGRAERKLPMRCSQLPEAWALPEGPVSTRTAARALVRAGGPQRLQVWAPGLPGTAGHLQARGRAARAGRGVGQISPGSGSPKLSSSAWESPAGRQGAWSLPMTVVE